jgi:hypothetical protein
MMFLAAPDRSSRSRRLGRTRGRGAWLVKILTRAPVDPTALLRGRNGGRRRAQLRLVVDDLERSRIASAQPHEDDLPAPVWPENIHSPPGARPTPDV